MSILQSLAHCVLCGKQSTGPIEDHDAAAVNDAIISGELIMNNNTPAGVCFKCIHEAQYLRACACEWIHPGGNISAGMRLSLLLSRLYKLDCVPASRDLRCLYTLTKSEMLSLFEREMDLEEERQRTAARNAAIAWDANHDCREQQR